MKFLVNVKAEIKAFEWKHFDLKIKDKDIVASPPATAQCENVDENMKADLSIAIVSMTLRKTCNHSTHMPPPAHAPTV